MARAEYEGPTCRHGIDMACYQKSWADCKAPNIKCCKCGSVSNQSLWRNVNWQKAEIERQERFGHK